MEQLISVINQVSGIKTVKMTQLNYNLYQFVIIGWAGDSITRIVTSDTATRWLEYFYSLGFEVILE